MKCVDCGIRISIEQGHLCDSCYKERLKKAILSIETLDYLIENTKENESHMPKRAEVSE